MRFFTIFARSKQVRWVFGLGVACAFASGCIHPSSTSAPATAEIDFLQTDTPINAPLLWRLNYHDQTCYLLGTIHLGVDARRELPVAVWRAFDSVTTFVSEHDLKSLELTKPGTRSRGEDSLSATLSETAWSNLTETLPNIRPAELQNFPTGIAALNYQLALMAEALPVNIPQMDRDLAVRALEKEMKMVFLETAEQALGAIAETVSSHSELEAMLVRDRKEFRSELLTQLRDLIKVYRSGDLRRLEDETTSQMPMRVYEIIVAQRNQQWIKSLLPHLKTGNCLVAVGAAHMVGQDSLLRLLEDEGVKIERIAP